MLLSLFAATGAAVRIKLFSLNYLETYFVAKCDFSMTAKPVLEMCTDFDLLILMTFVKSIVSLVIDLENPVEVQLP